MGDIPQTDKQAGSLDDADRIAVVDQYLDMLMTDIPEALCDLVRIMRASIISASETVEIASRHTERVMSDLQRVQEQLQYAKLILYRLIDEANKASLVSPMLRALHGTSPAGEERRDGMNESL